MTAVPFADPSRMTDVERAAITAAVDNVLRNGPYIGGPFLERFEKQFAGYIGVAHGVGVDNGSNALVLALQALALPPGSTVLVPPNDGGFAAAAAQAAGLVPAAVDVDAETMLVTVDTLQAAWSEQVTAVVATHLHGLACDIVAIAAWTRDRGLALVEDCAQSHGARVDGQHVGSFGDLATFSFYPTKNLGAFGDGGAVVTSRAALADRVRLLRQYGWEPRLRITDPQGRNCRLDPLQAAILSVRLPGLDAANEVRRAIVDAYRDAAPDLNIVGRTDASFVAHHAVIRTRDRAGFRAHLAAHGVVSDVHYPYLIGEMPGLRLAPGPATPTAAALQRAIVSVPCFPTMTASEIAAVITALCTWDRA